MALTATMRRFQINLSNVDRGIYETIDSRVAQHPSETELYLITRILALVLEYRHDLSFGRGVSTPEDPGMFAPNSVGGYALWIEFGIPSSDRLHKVSKQADQLIVYAHKNPESLLEELASGNIHKAESINVVTFPPEFLSDLADRVSRNNTWDALITEGTLYITVDDETIQCNPQVYRGDTPY